jgi:hypothetical protein
MFHLNLYTANLRHDKGKVTINVLATSPESAKTKIMLAENCPESTIISLFTTKKQP